MANKWLTFLKEYRKKNPTLSLKQAMKSASGAYKKSAKAAPAKALKKKARKKKAQK